MERKQRTEFTLERQQTFLRHLAESANVSESAKKANMSRRAVYVFKDARDSKGILKNPEFGKLWEEAINIAIDALEGEARRRAFEGVEKPVGWYQGSAGGRVREYSDNLLMFLLKALRPDKYKERTEATVSGDITIIKQEPGYKGSKKISTKGQIPK